MLKSFTATILSLILTVSTQATNEKELTKQQCRSVHLGYTKAVDDPCYAYIDLSIEKSSPGTYFCALGFHRGYFGAQELIDGKKVVTFSVVQPKSKPTTKNLPEHLRTKLIRKGKGVRIDSESDGAKSLFDYDWAIGEKISFLVKSIRVNDTTTRYTGYFYNNKTKHWQLMTEYQTLAEGKQLGNGIYSFIEDIGSNQKSATIIRRANFTNAWASTDGKTWLPMPKARFTGDNTPALNIDAGVTNNGFFLQTGGATTQSNTKLWETMETNIAKDKAIKVLPKELAEP